MKVTVSRSFRNFNLEQDPSYYDYTNYRIELGDIDNYRIVQRIGRGKYSEVFEGISTGRERIVIKVLKPVRSAKINREILILKHLDHKNIIKLKDVVHDKSSDTYSLIFDHIRHQETASLFEKLNLSNIRFYCRQMLEALHYAHSRGIVHRDIKPQNMIIDSHTKQLKIIDWGLAEFYLPEQEYSVRVASRYYKGPELLVGYVYYDYSLDIWSFGCILAEFLFKKRPFFHGMKNSEQIQEIAKVLGTKDLRSYVEKYELPAQSLDHIAGMREDRMSLSDFVDESEHQLLEDGIGLLEKIFVYDHQERPSAIECLDHRFFN